MRFEESIDIHAEQQRVWDVLSDLEAWPNHVESVDIVELLTPPPVALGSRFRLKQPKLPEGTWVITAWEPPTFFAFRQSSGGVTSVAGHRVEALDEGRSRLILSLNMRGVMVPVIALFLRALTHSYMTAEAQSIKGAAESVER